MKATTTNIKRALESKAPVRIKHHLGASLLVDDAKPLGFGTKSVMVQIHRANGWTVVCPLTWSLE